MGKYQDFLKQFNYYKTSEYTEEVKCPVCFGDGYQNYARKLGPNNSCYFCLGHKVVYKKPDTKKENLDPDRIGIGMRVEKKPLSSSESSTRNY